MDGSFDYNGHYNIGAPSLGSAVRKDSSLTSGNGLARDISALLFADIVRFGAALALPPAALICRFPLVFPLSENFRNSPMKILSRTLKNLPSLDSSRR